ncbi:hypothetical protein PBRA_001268, partial [Plasmodiophora brassicae]
LAGRGHPFWYTDDRRRRPRHSHVAALGTGRHVICWHVEPEQGRRDPPRDRADKGRHEEQHREDAAAWRQAERARQQGREAERAREHLPEVVQEGQPQVLPAERQMDHPARPHHPDHSRPPDLVLCQGLNH